TGSEQQGGAPPKLMKKKLAVGHKEDLPKCPRRSRHPERQRAFFWRERPRHYAIHDAEPAARERYPDEQTRAQRELPARFGISHQREAKRVQDRTRHEDAHRSVLVSDDSGYRGREAVQQILKRNPYRKCL